MVEWAKAFRLHANAGLKQFGYSQYYPSESYLDGCVRCAEILFRKIATNSSFDREDLFYLALYAEPTASDMLRPEEAIRKAKIKDGKFERVDYVHKSRELEKFFADAVRFINPCTEVPSLSGYSNTYEDMIRKLVILELLHSQSVTTHPFAPGLDVIGSGEIEPYIREMMRHPNRRLRRQAIFQFGLSEPGQRAAELFRIFEKEKDNVVKCRILFLLSRVAVPELTKFLIGALKKERDPVLKTAIIRLLGRSLAKEAFPCLIEQLEKSTGDFETCLALIKAAVQCIDRSDAASMDRFKRKCRELFDKAKDPGIFPRPDYYITVEVQQGNRYGGSQAELHGSPMDRQRIIMEVLQVALAVCGATDMEQKVQQRLKPLVGKPVPHEGLLGEFHYSLRVFVVECLPLLSEGKKYLEALIKKELNNDLILTAALKTYLRAYPDGFEEILAGVMKNMKGFRPAMRYYLLSFLGSNGLLYDSVVETMKKIVSGYSSTMDEAEKLTVSTAAYYLGLTGELSSKSLIKIARGESKLRLIKSMRDTNPDLSAETGLPVVQANPEEDSQLLRIAIETLGENRDRDAMKCLTRLAKCRDVVVRRLAARALRNLEDDTAQKALLNMLVDTDGWVRVAAYFSLKQITGAELKVDWFFSDSKEIRQYATDYRNKISDALKAAN